MATVRWTSGRTLCTIANYNVTALADSSGAVVERFEYDAYGEMGVMDGNWQPRTASQYDWEVTYAGYRWDAETGLYQVRNRYLHPRLGRWVQQDPLGYVDGLNLYEYVGSSPLIGVDSLGLYQIVQTQQVRSAPVNQTYRETETRREGCYDVTYEVTYLVTGSMVQLWGLEVNPSRLREWGEGMQSAGWAVGLGGGAGYGASKLRDVAIRGVNVGKAMGATATVGGISVGVGKLATMVAPADQQRWVRLQSKMQWTDPVETGRREISRKHICD